MTSRSAVAQGRSPPTTDITVVSLRAAQPLQNKGKHKFQEISVYHKTSAMVRYVGKT